MPLPDSGVPWPPPNLTDIFKHMEGWDAWYAGDGERLAVHYGRIGPVIGGTLDHIQTKPGLIGRMARWFWGQPQTGTYRTKLHVPIAADLCQAGADLLYAEPPTFTVPTNGGKDNATQDRLVELADDNLHGVLAEGVEIGAALGGHFLRVAWDRTVADRPFLTCVHADRAIPEFRYGRLTAVTFWQVVSREEKAVWRHLERHELDSNGVGVVLHGLYKGDDGDLGQLVPLTEQPATLPLAALVGDGDVISTESPGLAVVYIPNQRPQRRWRKDPVGSALGRSTLDGIEHLMDALDETYSSWMRDVRLGKARVFVPETMLTNLGAGKGATFDQDQEIFHKLNAAPGSLNPNGKTGTSTGFLHAEQFAIRYQEHQATAQQLVEDILRTAGYSSQTFGMDSTGGRMSNLTATEVQARERRSYMTRDRMIRLAHPQVAQIVGKLLAVDQAVFRSKVTPETPDVTFADSVQESQITLAQTAQALKAAEAASTKTLVQMVHPDWPDDRVNDEVALIHSESAAQVPDPTQLHMLPGFSGDIPTSG